MHPFHDYLCQQLGQKLDKRRIVVVYDERKEFLPFFDRELEEVGTGYDGLPRVLVGEQLTFLSRYQGSFFALRAAVEPIAAQENPEPLVVYLPGISRDRKTSPLMELEKAGTCYEPQLRRLALNVLRKRFTDGQIDEMMRPASIGYDDIVSFLGQGEQGRSASVLRTIFDGTHSEALLASWLADDTKDQAVAEKDATPELLTLIKTRLGLALPPETTVTDARDKTIRYVLVSEFRTDLDCDAPPSVSMVPTPPSKEDVDRIRQVAERLRRGHDQSYVEIAEKVEADLSLATAPIDAAHLGSIDTFRFEERALLTHAGKLIAAKRYVDALGIVSGRARSFWVDRDVSRQSQWEACRLLAELGREIERIRPALSKMGNDSARWVSAYAAEDGWHQVDALQRRLETWVAKMEEDPECEQALGVVRHEHEDLLKRMADGFAKTFAESAWTVPGALHQTRVYPEVVATMGGPVAYFFVDAMRFEMGVELARQLEGAKDLTIRAAVAALPTITPVGMAALLPGASASFAVIEHKGKLAARVEGTPMPSLNPRQKFLKAKVPGVCDLVMGNVLDWSSKKLASRIDGAPLVLVRSQEIDLIGETDGGFVARQLMSGIIGNIARAVRKLASAGIENFVVTADHGHQFSVRKEDDMKTDNPGGDTIDIHRRCWIGHGGTTPSGTVRVTGAELGYDTDLDFVFPTGLGVFKTGGGLSFHHGSVSLQELLVPVLSLRIPSEKAHAESGRTAALSGLPKTVTNRTFGIRLRIFEQMKLGDTAEASVPVRVILTSGSEQVGQAGLAVDAELDRVTGVIHIKPGQEASIGLILSRDDCASVRVVVQDPATDAVLDQSDELPVKLGI